MTFTRTLLSCIGLALSPTLWAQDLLDTYQLALKNDPTYLGAIHQHQSLEESLPQARAALLPNLSLQGSKNRNKPNIYHGVVVNTSSYSLSLNQPLFQYDSWAKLQQADATVKQAAAQFAASQQDLILRVATAYFNVQAAADNLKFANAAEKQFANQLKQTKLRYEVGLAAITEVKEAEAKYEASYAAAVKADNTLSDRYEDLKIITGGQDRPLLAKLRDSIPLLKPTPANIDSWVETAKKQDYTLQAARYQVDIQRANISAKKAGHLPSVALSGSFSGAETPTSNNNSSNNNNNNNSNSTSTQFEKGWTVGVTMTVPLFSGGGVSSSVRQAEEDYEKSLEDLEKSMRTTVAQTRSAYRGIVTNISQVDSLKQAVISSEAALEATKAGFEVGTKTNVDVLDRIADLQQQQQSYAQARYDYVTQILTLEQAAGTLSIDDLRQVNGWLVSATDEPVSKTPVVKTKA